jgi:hypothetical protein
MPSSIASSLGFIDEKYTLVALEEDALPSEVANQYNSRGVPLLDPKDIFAESNESVLTVASWLTANPPESMSKSSYPYYYYPRMWLAGGDMVFKDVMLENVVPAKNTAGVAVRIATPAAQVISETSESVIYDYLSTNVNFLKSNKVSNKVLVSVENGSLLVDLSLFDDKEFKNLTIVIFDLKGRIIRVLYPSLFVSKRLHISTEQLGLSRGAYFMKINGNNIKISQRFIVR